MKDSTVSKVCLPIDDVVDRVYAEIMDDTWGPLFPEYVLGILAGQTPYVISGVLEKHRAVYRDGA